MSPRMLSEQYYATESPVSATSSGTANIQTIAPSARRCVGAWISVEGIAARVTFDGTNPGVGTGPGIVFPAGLPAVFVPFAFTPTAVGVAGQRVKFASNVTGSSTVTAVFAT